MQYAYSINNNDLTRVKMIDSKIFRDSKLSVVAEINFSHIFAK